MDIKSLQAFTNISTAAGEQELRVANVGPGATPPPRRGPVPGAPEPPSGTPSSVGVFITPQSIVTFPGASSVVIIISAVLSAVIPNLRDSKVMPLVLSFLVGLIIYFISLTDEMTARQKRIGLVIALVNCFFLAASVLGIDTALSGPSTSPGP